MNCLTVYLGSYHNENGVYFVYWNRETHEVIDEYGTATQVVGYAKTLADAKAQNPNLS